MRVSVVGAQFPDSLARNFSATFRRMGHCVQEVDQERLAGALSPTGALRSVRRIVHYFSRPHEWIDARVTKALISFRPDVVLSTYCYWHPEAVGRARTALPHAKFLYLFPDSLANMGREYPLAAPYDALFFKDPYAVEMFRSRLGLNAHYLPEACNPQWHRPVRLTVVERKFYGCDVTTAGALYIYRALQLEPLLELDVKVWGINAPGWTQSPVRRRYTGQYVAELEKSKAFRAAKIVLNTHSAKEFEGTNARTFEAAGCGAFQIADWRPVLEDLFVDGQDIVTYRSRDELLEKVSFYLRHPELRRKIARAARRRAHAEHTYEKRIEQMLRVAWDATA